MPSPAKVFSAAMLGLHCLPIEVEVDMSPGLYNFQIVGLPDAAVNESKERVSSAIKNSGASPPHHTNRRVIVNLAPADIKKEGPAYDLPIAVAFLLASDQLLASGVADKIFVGELSLEGKLRPVSGALPIAIMARDKGFKEVFVPKANAAEAALIKEITVFGIDSLEQLFLHLEQKETLEPQTPTELDFISDAFESSADFAYIRGQEHAKRALEIAAAGHHNILMSGPPGTGKTLLARALPAILPNLSFEEALETTKIFSIAGRLSPEKPILTRRPFRSPHHTSSAVALVGGGNHPKPGEITLAHRGVLFLDELPEFHRDVLEALRQPLEDGVITVSRALGALEFPAQFMLVAAMNPCPCGHATNPDKQCVCSPAQVSKYKRRISGPLIDRIDLHIDVPAIKYDKLAAEKMGEDSQAVRERVQAARARQQERFKNDKIKTNSEMNLQLMKKHCQLDSAGQEILKTAAQNLHLSARSYHRILKLSRTIADLVGAPNIQSRHLAEALQYRPKEDAF
ncbi:MAG: YifB family Mg chelatase-like AAA ATPase [Candidatus Portnoybacteria bacterium]|nr:YifB family Mg chelatase-like AAA ATPase [Candidatus Portnoybacteria bacterium]MDD4982736.1 YifB family Mg chelatase-like AAA ATPase [Candidatus Portnoybacteria bacterium]